MPQVLLWALLLALLVLLAAPARGDADPEQRFTELVGNERASAGIASLVVAGDLIDVARRHAARMADEGRLHHNPNLGAEVRGWQVVGENVGRGADPDEVHAAFMASATHRANILDGRFTQIGVGVVARDSDLWVVEVFRRPAPPPAPATASVAPAASVRTAAPAPARTVAPAPPPPTTTTTTSPPLGLRPPVAGLPAGPARRALGEVEVLAVPASLAIPLPEIPLSTKLAATLLVAVVAAQAVTLRRLRLI